ncbi:hypothetical protein Ahy_B08g091256 [Arachis hypogaea]|uniref:PB1-like domain-containing protein n=1 Tax=Arachis hypogaea TaxID=3818 RepID=A0A444Y1T9_ARAHY|nr:hypothetical protein Ahy_B08g091256 [Arachis hypogaea]
MPYPCLISTISLSFAPKRVVSHKMEGPPMTFVFHHGGLFRTGEDGDMIYEPDNTEVLMGVEGDTLDVFFVRGYYKELGYIACESFNAKIKHEMSKPILTLAEEVRRIIMKSMVDNRKKLQNYQEILPPVQQSRLEAMTVLSRHWAPQWSGDEKEELYEVHGWPTNMVVDLGKHTCTCRF